MKYLKILFLTLSQISIGIGLTAQSTIDENKWYHISPKIADDKVLDIGGGNLHIHSVNGETWQYFRFEKAGYDGNIPLYYIRSMERLAFYGTAPALSIDVYAFQKNNGDKVVGYRANDKDNQKFRVKDEGEGYVSFSPFHVGANKYLDLYAGQTDNNSPVKLYDDSGNREHQLFKLKEQRTVKAEERQTTFDQSGQTLLIYFLGSDKSLSHQLPQLGFRLKADVQIYINGVGNTQENYDNYNNKNIKVIHTSNHNNYSAFHDLLSFGSASKNTELVTFYNGNSPAIANGFPAKIYGINRVYDGSVPSGYENKDSEMVAYEVLKLLKEYELKGFSNIVIAGHSRGSAVGIPSLLYGLKYAKESKSGVFRDFGQTVDDVFSNANINIVALDPVSGGDNDYHMGANWDTGDIYRYMDETFSVSFSEVYANAARMLKIFSFDPSPHYLNDPRVEVHRYWLSYRHSAMINEFETYSNIYKTKMNNQPFDRIVDYLNAGLNNQKLFRDKSNWTNTFRENDEICWDWVEKNKGNFDAEEISKFLLRRHATFRNIDGSNVDLEQLIGSPGGKF